MIGRSDAIVGLEGFAFPPAGNEASSTLPTTASLRWGVCVPGGAKGDVIRVGRRADVEDVTRGGSCAVAAPVFAAPVSSYPSSASKHST